MLSVRTKILFIAVASLLACIVTFATVTILSDHRRTEAAELASLERVYRSHNDTVWIIQQGCESILQTIAQRPDVRKALKSGDREELLALLLPTYERLAETFSIVQLYVHSPDGMVLLRVHDPQGRGDSYAGHRQMVLDALLDRKTVTGIEIDRRMSLRTVTPIMEGTRVIGLLEIGRNYDQAWLNDLKKRRDADFRVWLSYDAAGPTGLWPKDGPLRCSTPELFFYAATFVGPPLPRAAYDKGLAGGEVMQFSQRNGQAFSTLIAPLRGYNGEILGLIEISRSREGILADLRQSLVTNVLLAAAAAACGMMVLGLFLRSSVIRPLRALVAAAHRQYDGDLSARAAPAASGELGLLAKTFNSLSNRLTETLRQQQTTIDQVQEAKEAADEANAAKDQFLAALSHELRTPLTPVLLAAESLEANPNLPAELHDDVQAIRRNVQLEARLIDDLLDLTRISRGKLALQAQICDVHSLLAAAVAVCKGDIAARRLAFTTDFQAEHQHVNGDPPRLEQVFWNLIKNAVKFTPEGGAITVSTRNEFTDNAGWFVLSVSDTGIGMAPETLGRIFRHFEQGSRDITRTFGGLGLGLAISKAIVDLHSGRIVACSEGPGEGSLFTVYLPTVTAPAASAQPCPMPLGPEQQSLRILLVEDHAPTARALLRLLRDFGHHPHAAGDIASARLLAGQQTFDLLISDLGLPDGHGTTLMAELRKTGLRGIALSGYGMQEDVERCLAAGFGCHLTKPITTAQLRQAIRAVAPAPTGPPQQPTATCTQSLR